MCRTPQPTIQLPRHEELHSNWLRLTSSIILVLLISKRVTALICVHYYITNTLFPSEPPRFTLVNSTGNLINGTELGLLLFFGGTVCNDYFSDNAAEAICKQMNYSHSVRWTSQESFDIQVDANV